MTKRFYLRELVEQDATSDYLSWLQDEYTSKFITHTQSDLSELKLYITKNKESNKTLFFGIFCQKNDKHIGNIKYENIIGGSAVMGILIGHKSWRGQGVASEVIPETLTFLQKETQVLTVYLGVELENKIAIAVYQKIGFLPSDSPPFSLAKNGLAMYYNLKQ